MTPPPDNRGQINPSGMPPLADAGRLDTDHIGGSVRAAPDEGRLRNAMQTVPRR